ncbi:MAG: hypothetical protein AB8U25_05350 [Rickettsiales endosymbiont of Dermacentor nuttalli]
MAGFILTQLPQIPNAEDYFIFQDYKFEVIDMDKIIAN